MNYEVFFLGFKLVGALDISPRLSRAQHTSWIKKCSLNKKIGGRRPVVIMIPPGSLLPCFRGKLKNGYLSSRRQFCVLSNKRTSVFTRLNYTCNKTVLNAKHLAEHISRTRTYVPACKIIPIRLTLLRTHVTLQFITFSRSIAILLRTTKD